MGGWEGLLVVCLRGAFRLTALSTWMHDIATAWTTSRLVQVNTYTNNFSLYPLPGPVANIFILHTRPAIHLLLISPQRSYGPQPIIWHQCAAECRLHISLVLISSPTVSRPLRHYPTASARRHNDGCRSCSPQCCWQWQHWHDKRRRHIQQGH